MQQAIGADKRISHNAMPLLPLKDLKSSNGCRECHSPLKSIGRDIVCTKCGLINGSRFSHRLPFGQTYQPTSLIVFDKGMGDTLRPSDMFQVLALAPRGTEDLPLRARQIRVMVQTQVPPQLRRALEYASNKLLAMFPMENHLISNDAAKLIRSIVAWFLLSKRLYRTCCIVDAVIYYILRERYSLIPDQPPRVEGEFIKVGCILRFKQSDLDVVRWFDQSMRYVG